METTPSDITIIGAGVIGLCSAYYLQKSGLKVTVVDRTPAADQHGCSFINCGYISPSHFVPLASPGVVVQGLKWMFNNKSPLYIKPRLDADLMRWLWHFTLSSNQKHVDKCGQTLLDMNLASGRLYDELAASHGLQFELKGDGLLMLTNTKKGYNGEADVVRSANDLGLKARMIDREEVHRMEPHMLPEVVGAAYFPEDGHIRPGQFMAQLRHLLVEAKVKFVHDEVEKVDFDASGNVLVLTTSGPVLSKKLLVASGSWSSHLVKKLGLAMPMQAGKGYSMTVSEPAYKLKHPCILTEKRVALTPWQGALRFGGTMELSGLSLKINQNRVEAIQESSMLYLPKVTPSWFRNVQVERGLRPVSPDGMPYIGKINGSEKLFVAAGHAMLGMSMGPITGKLIAQLVMEQTPDFELETVRPNRFS